MTARSGECRTGSTIVPTMVSGSRPRVDKSSSGAVPQAKPVQYTAPNKSAAYTASPWRSSRRLTASSRVITAAAASRTPELKRGKYGRNEPRTNPDRKAAVTGRNIRRPDRELTETGANHPGQFVGQGSNRRGMLPLDHDAQQGLGAGIADQDATRSVQSLFSQ